MSPRVSVAAAIAIVLGLSAPAAADSIRVTNGAFVWNAGNDSAGGEQVSSDLAFALTLLEPLEAVSLRGDIYTDLNTMSALSDLADTWRGAIAIPLRTAGVLSAPFDDALAHGEATAEPIAVIGSAPENELPLSAHDNSNGLPAATSHASVVVPVGTAPAFSEAENPTPNPEPASVLLLGTGLAGLAALRRRRQSGA